MKFTWLVALARGAGRQHKAWGGARVFPSGTPGSLQYRVAAREVGDSLFIISDLRSLHYRTLRALYSSYCSATWGSVPISSGLHPRLYAIAPLRGLKKKIKWVMHLNQTFL
ncbi:MAG TPA: hypothetical protein VJV03_16115 [Pyrinomonadaceae bacterium]|nr:hypothetical protein [Pyrinomonadaceae bacterium]